jgi:formylmethanofuran dehydrogenase subunit E
MITIIIITIIIILINKLDKIISKQNTNDSIKSINKPIESIDTDKFNNKYTKKTDILNTEKLFDINKIDHKFLE